MSELKPCPFCGANARMWASNRDDKEIIGCSNHMCVLEPTTEEYMDKDTAVKAWNTRAVPDVPELVRYSAVKRYGREEVIEKDDHGEYVLHTQAAEIIAALTERLKNTETAMGSIIDERIEETKRAEAAEAKLAQYEAQESSKLMNPTEKELEELLQRFLSEGYAYEVLGASYVSDNMWDTLCLILRHSKKRIPEWFWQLVDEDQLHSGSALGTKWRDSDIKIAKQLLEKHGVWDLD